MFAHGQILKFEIDYIISVSGKACRPVASASLWRWRAQCPARKYFASCGVYHDAELSWPVIGAFARRDWGKPQTFQSGYVISPHLPNTSVECYLYTREAPIRNTELGENRTRTCEVLFQPVVLCCYEADSDADIREQVTLQWACAASNEHVTRWRASGQQILRNGN